MAVNDYLYFLTKRNVSVVILMKQTNGSVSIQHLDSYWYSVLMQCASNCYFLIGIT